MPRPIKGRSGRVRHYHESPAPVPAVPQMSKAQALRADLMRRSGARSEYEYEQGQKFNQHAAQARRANAERVRQAELDRIAKQQAYERSIRGRVNNYRDRAIGGMSSAYGTGRRIAGNIGDMGRGAWELAKKAGRGALAFGRGLISAGRAAKTGAKFTYDALKTVNNSRPDVGALAGATKDLLTGNMSREDFNNKSREHLENLGRTWTKPIDFIDEHMDNWANDHIEGSRLQDYAGRAASGLGELISMPGRALGGIANWWEGRQ